MSRELALVLASGAVQFVSPSPSPDNARLDAWRFALRADALDAQASLDTTHPSVAEQLRRRAEAARREAEWLRMSVT